MCDLNWDILDQSELSTGRMDPRVRSGRVTTRGQLSINAKGCSLGRDVSVSRRYRDLLFQCLGLVSVSGKCGMHGLGLGLVSD